MLCDLLLKFTACCAVTAVTALQCNAGHALDVYQVLTRFKNRGEHKHDRTMSTNVVTVSSVLCTDETIHQKHETPLLPVVMIPHSQMLT